MNLIIFLIITLFSNVFSEVAVSFEGKQTKSNWCCQITPPSLPLFDGNGNLLFYQPQKCPAEYIVCCRGLINIQGYCIHLDLASQMLPQWQQLAISQGISLSEVIQQSGLIDLSNNNDINYLKWDTVELYNAQTGLVLDSDTNGNVYTLKSNGGNYQRWQWEFKENGWNYIKNKETGLYLTGDSSRRVYTTYFVGSNEQLWMVWNNRLLNNVNNFPLDSNYNGQVYLLEDNGGGYQTWYLRHL